MKNLPLVILALWPGAFCAAQVPITLSNPSFEDYPRHSQAPSGWVNCGFPGESPVDIQPGYFGVSTKARHGATYVGMVVRASDTREAITQKLSKPMTPGAVYTMYVFLARSAKYLSPVSNVLLDSVNFSTPVVLRIHGGREACGQEQFLAETPLVTHTEWRRYQIIISPDEAWSHITFEAYYNPDATTTYYGNILMDDFSALLPINLQDADEEVLGTILGKVPPEAFFPPNPNHAAATLIHFVMNFEEILQDMGMAGYLKAATADDFPRVAQNLELLGAGSHAAALRQIGEVLTVTETGKKRMINDAEKLWAGIEQSSPLSSIRRQFTARHREQVVDWLEAYFKR